MRITFLQDMDPLVVGGGAQLTDRLIVREAFKRGHEVEIVTPESWRDNDYGSDLVFISNTTRFNPAQLVMRKSRHVVFHHDYYFCRTRLYFPLQEKCKSCPYLGPWRTLFDSAMLNVFMSPLHRDACLSVLPELGGLPNFLCPSLLDPALWPRSQEAREANSVMGLNCLLPYKGRENALSYARNHPLQKFTFAGAAEGEGDIPANARWIGPVDGKALRDLFARSESFLHLPSTPQPSERSAIEARLSGCRLIVNAMVGITSYDEWKLPEDEFRKWLAGQPARLWEAIENA